MSKIVGVIAVAVILGVVFFMKAQKNTKQDETMAEQTTTQTTEQVDVADTQAVAGEQVSAEAAAPVAPAAATQAK